MFIKKILMHLRECSLCEIRLTYRNSTFQNIRVVKRNASFSKLVDRSEVAVTDITDLWGSIPFPFLASS